MFKIGDEIVCIDDKTSDYLKIYNTYTITDILNKSYGTFLILREVPINRSYDIIRFILKKQYDFNKQLNTIIYEQNKN